MSMDAMCLSCSPKSQFGPELASSETFSREVAFDTYNSEAVASLISRLSTLFSRHVWSP